jgi:hypothetical protein
MQRSMRAVSVDMVGVLAQHGGEVTGSGDQRSRHSRRRVPMKRSAIAFACGARTGRWMIRMSAPVNTALKTAVNVLSRSRINETGRRGRRGPRAGCGPAGIPRSGGVGGNPGLCTRRCRARSRRASRGGVVGRCRRGRSRRRGSRGPASLHSAQRNALVGTAAMSPEIAGDLGDRAAGPRHCVHRRSRYGQLAFSKVSFLASAWVSVASSGAPTPGTPASARMLST